jgi:Tfp pilus assembly protein PilX
MMPTHSRRRGVALPVTLLTLILLAVLLAAGFTALGAERRINANADSQTAAFTIAESGLELFLNQRDSLGFTSTPPAASESARVTLQHGYADVVLTRIRSDSANDRYGYAVRSHGVDTSGALTGTAQAERTVAEYAVWQPATMKTWAGFTGLNGILKNGGSSLGSGTDACGKQPPVAGVAVPASPGYVQNGGSLAVSGNPPVLNVAATPSQMADSVHIDWAGISSGTSVNPDVTIPGGTWPTSFSNWPVILVNGDYSLPSNGQGTLIVTGSLTMSGSQTWDGLVLVGNTVTINGSATIDGALVTGLNIILGQSVGVNSIGNGVKHINYDSCYLANALNRFANFTGLSNAWVDNWPGY